ncbi:MAG: universal stress protein [Trueperaceae bacterium]|nr:MAG: universal stress protein [Trueperaceae bacterium]
MRAPKSKLAHSATDLSHTREAEMDILHPTDFSKAAEKARQLALDLCTRLSAKLHVVHVQQRFEEARELEFLRSSVEGINPELLRRIEELHQAETQRLLARLKQLAPADGNYDLLWGPPLQELLGLVGAYQLVVMGAHGANPLDNAFLGGIAGRLVRRSPIPVLTVREEATSHVLGRILVATDFGEASRRAWSFCRRLHEAGIKLVAAHVIDERRHHGDPAYTRQVDEGLEAFSNDLAERLVIREGNPVSLLPAIAEEVGADAIAIGLHRHATATGLLLGSRADALLRSSPVPILSVPLRR